MMKNILSRMKCLVLVAVFGMLLLAAGGQTAVTRMNGNDFLDMCEAYGRSEGIRAAAASCKTLRSVCLPSKRSGRSGLFETAYIDSMMLDVLRDSCETIYITTCRNTAMRMGKKIPGCRQILMGTAFTTSYCPDVETAVDIFDEGLTGCDEVPAEMFAVAGYPPPNGHSTPTLPKIDDVQRNREAFMRSSFGRTLQSASNKLPEISGAPNDPCDCTYELSGGQEVDIQGCEDNVCYTVGGKGCDIGFPSAKYPGAYMRLCAGKQS